MESFVVRAGQKTYKIIRCTNGNATFKVFNYSSFHTITKTNFNSWEVVEHRFGDHQIPLQQIGRQIEQYLGSII